MTETMAPVELSIGYLEKRETPAILVYTHPYLFTPDKWQTMRAEFDLKKGFIYVEGNPKKERRTGFYKLQDKSPEFFTKTDLPFKQHGICFAAQPKFHDRHKTTAVINSDGTHGVIVIPGPMLKLLEQGNQGKIPEELRPAKRERNSSQKEELNDAGETDIPVEEGEYIFFGTMVVKRK